MNLEFHIMHNPLGLSSWRGSILKREFSMESSSFYSFEWVLSAASLVSFCLTHNLTNCQGNKGVGKASPSFLIVNYVFKIPTSSLVESKLENQEIRETLS